MTHKRTRPQLIEAYVAADSTRDRLLLEITRLLCPKDSDEKIKSKSKNILERIARGQIDIPDEVMVPLGVLVVEWDAANDAAKMALEPMFKLLKKILRQMLTLLRRKLRERR